MLWSSQTIIINALRSYINHLKECFIRYPNTLKLVKKNSATPHFFIPILRVWISDETLFHEFYININWKWFFYWQQFQGQCVKFFMNTTPQLDSDSYIPIYASYMKHKVLLNALGLNRHFLLVIFFPYTDHVMIPIRVFSFKVGHFHAHTQSYNIYELDKASNLLGIITNWKRSVRGKSNGW